MESLQLVQVRIKAVQFGPERFIVLKGRCVVLAGAVEQEFQSTESRFQ